MSKSKSRWVLPLEETLKLKHFILFFGQFGHLLSDSLHECRGGEAAEGNAVNVLHHLRQVLLGWCARGEGGLLQRLLIFQRQPGGAALWVAGVRKSLYVTWQRQLENKKARLLSGVHGEWVCSVPVFSIDDTTNCTFQKWFGSSEMIGNGLFLGWEPPVGNQIESLWFLDVFTPLKLEYYKP